MRRRRQLISVVAVVLAGSASASCGADPNADSEATSPSQPANSSRALPRLRVQANQLLDGGPDAFRARLAELRGHPVVVNQWASWCGPCRFEFPFFERQATKHEGRVAFLGVNSQDSRDSATKFLEQMPVSFPHYFDPDGSVARVFRGGRTFPTTAFYDASGKLVYILQGSYASEAKLQADIRRYALDV